MKNYKNTRLMVKCAKLYYEEGMNQIEIGKKLGVSKATISRLLNAAKKEGIVKINVNSPFSKENIELEKELENLFGLKEVVVVDVESNNREEIKNSISKEAAHVLERYVKTQMLIGISNGTTLSKIPKHIENNKKMDLTFVPIVGGSGQLNANIQSNNIAQNFAKAFKAHYKILHAPAKVESQEIKKIMIEDAVIKPVLELTEKLDIAIVGIGSPKLTSTVLMLSQFIKEDELKDLENKGAVADVCNLFTDSLGKSDSFDFNDNVIGIKLDALKDTPIVIGVAGHISKAEAIVSAIKAKFINILVTDYNTAKCILKKERENVDEPI